MKKIAIKLRKWNQIFCTGMVCRMNLMRDIIIVSVAIILSGVLIYADRYFYNKKIQYHEEAVVQETETLPTREIFDKTVSIQENIAVVAPVEIKTPVPQSVATRAITPKPTNPKAKGPACIKMPAKILPLIKNNPAPPDGKMKDGKLICHVLADGHKDYPQKSSRNPKGSWGGCCYDPDEVPNPACCYPVGSVYEKYLNKYFANPFPHRK
jgi:hypothetical protein